MKKPIDCFYCQKQIVKKTTDHIIPRMLGGTNHEKNKCKCCLECNSLKANYLPKHLAELIEHFFIPRAPDQERKDWLRRIYLRCIDLELNHIPKHKEVMIRQPFIYIT